MKKRRMEKKVVVRTPVWWAIVRLPMIEYDAMIRVWRPTWQRLPLPP